MDNHILKTKIMKLFISYVLVTILLVTSCKNESVTLSIQNNIKPTMQKDVSKQYYQHPFYVRYKTYRKNLNSSFMNHLGHLTYEGC